MTPEIPCGDETTRAMNVLEVRLEHAFPHAPWAIAEALETVVECKIIDAINMMADHVHGLDGKVPTLAAVKAFMRSEAGS